MKQSRRFVLRRDVDETGISGTGVVAHGVMWPDGQACLWWATAVNSMGVYPLGMESVEKIHGHRGKTQIVWIDEE